MQVYFINNHIDKNRIIEQHEANMNLKMKPLTHLIISTRLKGRNECDDYVKKLAVDIIAYYGLGNPENAQVSHFHVWFSLSPNILIAYIEKKMPFLIHFYDQLHGLWTDVWITAAEKGCTGDSERSEEYDVYEWCDGIFCTRWKR